MMIVTLHVDLDWTDLEDFTEHFEGTLRAGPFGRHYLLGPERLGLYWGNESYERPPIAGRNPVLPVKYWRVLADDAGGIGRRWWIMAGNARIGGDGAKLVQEESFHAYVEAIRYRRDRLKVTVREVGDGLGYGDRLLRWLKERWEDAVTRKEEATAPTFAGTRPTVYQESDIKTTLVHFLCTRREKTIAVATGLVQVSERTYRRHKQKGKLLSDQEFQRRTGTAIDEAAMMATQGAWYG